MDANGCKWFACGAAGFLVVDRQDIFHVQRAACNPANFVGFKTMHESLVYLSASWCSCRFDSRELQSFDHDTDSFSCYCVLLLDAPITRFNFVPAMKFGCPFKTRICGADWPFSSAS